MPTASKPNDDAAARLARAKRLRQQIKSLAARKTDPSAPPKSEAPASFIHRRMAELKEESKKKRPKRLKANEIQD